ncbi:MAG: energy transducer TonB [Bacteroidales bacterium]
MLKKSYILLCALFLGTLALPAQLQEYLPADNYGGKSQLREFIKEVMYYPGEARDNKVEGTVKVAFHVKKDGTIMDTRIKQSLSPETDAEALRMLSYLLFEPASARGAAFSEEKTLEFEFKLRRYKRCVRQRGYDKLEYPFLPVDSSMKIFSSKQLDQAPKPRYPDESPTFINFMLRNLNYPDAAVKQSISGTVELFFVVEPWGGISNLKIEDGVGAGCNEEAIRLVRLLRWMPGVKDGKAVRTRMNLSISFNLSDFENHRYVPAGNQNQI